MAGQRIDDHGFWAGKKGHASVFPDGPHKSKEYSSDGHMAELNHYEDTSEAIKDQQMMNEKKQKAHDRKPGHRN